MDKINFIKIIIVLAVVFALVGFLGFYFFRSSPEPILGTEIIGERSVESTEILKALQELKKLSIDGSVFDSAAFKSLVDYTLAVNPEDKQRPNPFAPIGSEDQGKPPPKKTTLNE